MTFSSPSCFGDGVYLSKEHIHIYSCLPSSIHSYIYVQTHIHTSILHPPTHLSLHPSVHSPILCLPIGRSTVFFIHSCTHPFLNPVRSCIHHLPIHPSTPPSFLQRFKMACHGSFLCSLIHVECDILETCDHLSLRWQKANFATHSLFLVCRNVTHP